MNSLCSPFPSVHGGNIRGVILALLIFALSSFAQTTLPGAAMQLLLPSDSVSVEMSLSPGDEFQWSLQVGAGSDGETEVVVSSDVTGELWSRTFNSDSADVREKIKISKQALYRITAKKTGTRGRPISLAAWPKFGKEGRTPFPPPSVQKSVAALAAGDHFAVEYEFRLPDTTRFETLLNLDLPRDMMNLIAVTPAGDSISGEASVRRWFGESGTISLRDMAKRGGSMTLRLECAVPEGGEIIFYRLPGQAAPAWLAKEARVVTIIEHMPWNCVIVPPYSEWRASELTKELLPPKSKYAAQGLRIRGVSADLVPDLTQVAVQRDSLYYQRRQRLAESAGYDSTFLEMTSAFDAPQIHAALTSPLAGEGMARKTPLGLGWFVESLSGKSADVRLFAWQFDEAILSYEGAPDDYFWRGDFAPLNRSVSAFSPASKSSPNSIAIEKVAQLRPAKAVLNGKPVRDMSRRVLGLYLNNTSNETLYLAYRVERPIERSTWASFKKWPKAARWAIGIAVVCAVLGGYAIWELRQRDKRRKKQAEEMAEELESARLVQQKLMPKGPLEVKGLQVLGLHQSMQSVGGDYYDFFPLDDGRILICVADVAGHGLPAALLMSNLQATLHAIASHRRPMNEMVALLNKEMVRRTSPERFVTLMLVEISADRSMLTVCNAGHNPGYLIRKHGSVVELDAGGIMLGVMDMFPFIEMEYSLEPGDLLAFYTDGIPEAEIGFEDMFGYDRLQYFLSQNRDRPLPDIAQKLFARVTQPNQLLGDDMAIVLVRIALGGESKQHKTERDEEVA
jgi:hypothetical protein